MEIQGTKPKNAKPKQSRNPKNHEPQPSQASSDPGAGVQLNAMRKTYAFTLFCALLCLNFTTDLTERRPLRFYVSREVNADPCKDMPTGPTA